jgi:hypothetical protein
MAIGTTAALVMGGATVASSLVQRNAAKKAQAQIDKLQYNPIDLAKLQTDARENAEQNLAKSIALEQKYMPQVSAARFELQSQIAQDLARGGKLPLDVANQVTRSSMAQAGAGGFGAGPLTAGQLGLTSLDLRARAQERANAFLAANQLPVSGLDPGALASAAIGQNQTQNQFDLSKAGAQANLIQSQGNAMSSMIGQLGALGGMYYSGGGSTNLPTFADSAGKGGTMINPFGAGAPRIAPTNTSILGGGFGSSNITTPTSGGFKFGPKF